MCKINKKHVCGWCVYKKTHFLTTQKHVIFSVYLVRFDRSRAIDWEGLDHLVRDRKNFHHPPQIIQAKRFHENCGGHSGLRGTTNARLMRYLRVKTLRNCPSKWCGVGCGVWCTWCVSKKTQIYGGGSFLSFIHLHHITHHFNTVRTDAYRSGDSPQ